MLPKRINRKLASLGVRALLDCATGEWHLSDMYGGGMIPCIASFDFKTGETTERPTWTREEVAEQFA